MFTHYLGFKFKWAGNFNLSCVKVRYEVELGQRWVSEQVRECREGGEGGQGQTRAGRGYILSLFGTGTLPVGRD